MSHDEILEATNMLQHSEIAKTTVHSDWSVNPLF
jgi:hypothetical protein